MNEADRLVAETMAQRFEFPVEDFDRIEFDPWIGCYSSWTCDYGISVTVHRKSGRTHYMDEFNMPAFLSEMAEFQAAQKELTIEHEMEHGL